jgi:hypothetical protein
MGEGTGVRAQRCGFPSTLPSRVNRPGPQLLQQKPQLGHIHEGQLRLLGESRIALTAENPPGRNGMRIAAF